LAGSLSGPPVVRAFANLPTLLANTQTYERADRPVSFEASCYTDVLGIEHLTGALGEAVRYFAGREGARLRFVSKYDHIESLMGQPHNGHTRARASLNAEPLARQLEGGTASIEARIQALRQLALPVAQGGGGYPVGIVANNPGVLAGVLDIDAARKAARFVRTCNAFGLPIVSLVDVPGFLPGQGQEHGGIIDHGAKLAYAYCEATVPKLSVILRKAYGGAYIVMGSKHVGGDMNFSWPKAEIAVMGASGAVEILHARDIRQHADPAARTAELVQNYNANFANPSIAEARGFLDGVLEPAQTRQALCSALRALVGKREEMPAKRNGNVPL
jgi:hypothetical protein